MNLAGGFKIKHKLCKLCFVFKLETSRYILCSLRARSRHSDNVINLGLNSALVSFLTSRMSKFDASLKYYVKTSVVSSFVDLGSET